jgi:ssDNA-binding Zn-finger/Zn-ribbon topoisomerase 1
MEITCPSCGEGEALRGERRSDDIELSCDTCGNRWTRSLRPVCGKCGSQDLQTVPLAIVEKGRGTQLSVVGTRPIDLCSSCDAAVLANYHRNRPNPLMPDELPTAGM